MICLNLLPQRTNGGSDLDDQGHQLVNRWYGCWGRRRWPHRLCLLFDCSWKTGEPNSTELAKIVNNVLVNPINREKIKKYPRPGNRKALKVKQCNSGTWSKIVYSKTRSKDLKLQKLQDCLLNSIGTISNVTSNLLGFKNNKSLPQDEIRKNLGNLIHHYTDVTAILNTNIQYNHLNTELVRLCW